MPYCDHNLNTDLVSDEIDYIASWLQSYRAEHAGVDHVEDVDGLEHGLEHGLVEEEEYYDEDETWLEMSTSY